jgi:hypothetical protein
MQNFADERGRPVVIDPYSGRLEHEVGPVRLAGMASGDSSKPLLHTKLLVLGRLAYLEYGLADRGLVARPGWAVGRR